MIVLCIFLCIACYFDYRQCRIPNPLILLGLTMGALRAVWLGGFPGALAVFVHAAAVVFVFYPLFQIGTLGSGDIKLFGLCAGYLPGEKILVFLFVTLMIAAVFSLFRFLREADFKERFLYLFAYLKEVAETGEWRLYWNDRKEQRKSGICLAGPVLISILLFMGGFY